MTKLMSDPAPPETSFSLETLLRDQQRRWQLGERAALETYLERFPPLRDNADAQLDLIYHEVILREKLGETPHLDDYLPRFPHLAEALRLQFDMDQAMRSARWVSSLRPSTLPDAPHAVPGQGL